MALSGIILVAISLLPFLHAHKLRLEIIRLKGDTAILSKQVAWTKIDVNALKSESESLTQRVKELKKDTLERYSKETNKETAFEICDIPDGRGDGIEIVVLRYS